MADENIEGAGGLSDRDAAMTLSHGERERHQERTLEHGDNANDILLTLRSRSEGDPELHQSDLRAYFEARKDDAKNSGKTQDRKRYESLVGTVLDIETHDEITERRKQLLLDEVEAELTHWRKASKQLEQQGEDSSEDTLADLERQIAEENVQVFSGFRNILYGTFGIEDETGQDEPLDVDTSQETMKNILPSPKEFEQYKIAPDRAMNALENVTGDITPEEFKNFYDELTQDISKGEENALDNPQWQAKVAIVEAAAIFNRQHSKDPEKGLIYVTANKDGTIKHVGWEATTETNSDVEVYILDPNGNFNPGAENNDSKGLDYHIYNIQQFMILIEKSLPNIHKGLEKLSNGEEIDPAEALSMWQLIKKYGGEHEDQLMAYFKEHVSKEDDTDGDESVVDEVLPENDDKSEEPDAHKTRQFMQNGRRLRKRYYI